MHFGSYINLIATEELAMMSGPTIGALLNATFGNVVELILGVIALKDGLIRVVQGGYPFVLLFCADSWLPRTMAKKTDMCVT